MLRVYTLRLSAFTEGRFSLQEGLLVFPEGLAVLIYRSGAFREGMAALLYAGKE
jgi:hypothetical protein